MSSADKPAPRFYNTATRQLEELQPLTPGQLRIYSCGPTLYDHAHIGNYRFFVWVDLLRRSLEWRGYNVKLVLNLTDIDDKTIAGARKTGRTLQEHTEEYAAAFFAGLEALRIAPADEYPRATQHIKDMVLLVQKLLDKGHAYERDGSIYFRVDSFERYGSLARLDPDQMRATERIEQDEYDKEQARDFVLWKAARDDEPSWDTAIGAGRPGWHLECSAMSMKYLGNTFDIHLGGVDLIFPHHENEIAQSEAATGEPFVRTWLHCSHLLVDGTKMSKSLGNFHTLTDLIDAGHDPVAIRYLLASVHYRRQLNFTFEALEQAKAAVARIRDTVQRAEQALSELDRTGDGDSAATQSAATPDDNRGGEPGSRENGLRAAIESATAGFRAAIDDDLNSAGALGQVFTLIRELNSTLDTFAPGQASGETSQAVAAALAWLRDVDKLWAILPQDDELARIELQVDGRLLVGTGPRLEPALLDKIVERTQARAARDFENADRLRDELTAAAIEVEDTPQGPRWRRL